MPLTTGSRLGPYEILAPIGAGGMGEVYRAKDPRLGREVAIKVLPASFSQDADRLRRFEQEAKAAGVLNHPNITAVYDVGEHEGSPYVVQELLEGETLRAALAGGRLSTRKAIEYALPIVHGLAAAHEKGIVHRDLKPENVFVTRDGRVKILDFGLAKLTQPESSSGQQTNLPTASAGTEPGVVMGTLGYMSPEQVRGKPADARSDIFSFGAILYEMVSGRRAFHGDTAADTMSAILKEDPPDLSATNQSVSPGMERLVRHCLEKNPEQRFQSARDLAFDLDALSTASGAAAVGVPRPRAGRGAVRALALAAGAILLLLAGVWLGRRGAADSSTTASGIARPSLKRLTFRRGNVLFARFTADGQSVVYGASWSGKPTEIYISRVGSPETRPLGIPGASLLSVSSSGELAVLLKKENLYGAVGTGTLARATIEGGAPRQIAEGVSCADWAPDGEGMAIVRAVEGKSVLEYPPGNAIYTAAGNVLGLRVSPDGKRVALIETDGSSYWIDLLDQAGHNKKVATDFVFVDAIAWAPSGKEVWFDGVDRATFRLGIWAMTPEGKSRIVADTLDLEVLHDIARDGSVLVEREISSTEIVGAFGGDTREKELSWLEKSQIAAIAENGKTMLFTEFGEAGGPNGTVYLRPTDGSPAVRLGEGRVDDLSPDGKWALTLAPSSDGQTQIVLLPTGAGAPKTVPVGGLRIFGGAFLPPDGKRLLIAGLEPGHGVRGYVVGLEGGKPRAFTSDTTNGGAVSPDGRYAAASDANGRPTIYPVEGGQARAVPGLEAGDVPIQWSADGHTLYATHYGLAPLPIYRVNLETGKKETWREVMPADRTGFVRIDRVAMTRDGRSYAYSYNVVHASDLYLVKGWK